MPRQARLDAPGVLHHVIIRGIERRHIFKDDKDRNNFIERLETLLPETHTSCYAWALLSNHAHFLFRTGDKSISTLMGRLLTGYAVTFNRRYRRHGQLFQNRYKSIICQEDAYLKELVRYIHLNPLRANVLSSISELNSYPYCGHGVLLGKVNIIWQDAGYVLSYFGKTTRHARAKYIAFIKEGIDQGRRPELTGGGLIRSLGGWKKVKEIRLSGQDRIKADQRILGESDFVQGILTEAEERYNRFYELKIKGYDLEKVEKRICKIFGIKREELFSRSRMKARTDARGLYCYWAARELGYALSELARQFNITVPGIVYAVRRGERISKEFNYRLIG
ncbi:MAG TPA: transposase [Desulfatiglandales bacterium]|nr:transposase [Desulfatiglandales bacterium]